MKQQWEVRNSLLIAVIYCLFCDTKGGYLASLRFIQIDRKGREKVSEGGGKEGRGEREEGEGGEEEEEEGECKYRNAFDQFLSHMIYFHNRIFCSVFCCGFVDTPVRNQKKSFIFYFIIFEFIFNLFDNCFLIYYARVGVMAQA